MNEDVGGWSRQHVGSYIRDRGSDTVQASTNSRDTIETRNQNVY